MATKAEADAIAAKIRHPRCWHVFIERQMQTIDKYKYIAHTGIEKFLPDLYDTQAEAIAAVDARLAAAMYPQTEKPTDPSDMTDWTRDVISFLNDVVTSDQRTDHNNTMQDTRHDGPFARRARELIDRAPVCNDARPRQ